MRHSYKDGLEIGIAHGGACNARGAFGRIQSLGAGATRTGPVFTKQMVKVSQFGTNFLRFFVIHLEKISRGVKHVTAQFFILLICAGMALSGAQDELLPDGSLRPGTRITIRAGERREILFQPEGVRFLSGRARITSVGKPFVGPEGQELTEFVIDVAKSPGIPWMHDEKPFRLRIHAETDFTLEARRTWEWTPDDEYQPL